MTLTPAQVRVFASKRYVDPPIMVMPLALLRDYWRLVLESPALDDDDARAILAARNARR